jgi:hypothetical protein
MYFKASLTAMRALASGNFLTTSMLEQKEL